MILIVGLGNPGTKYENTRHNVGFMAVDLLLKKLTSVDNSVWEENKKFKSLIAKVDKELILAKPLTYMNSSGSAVNKLMQFYKIINFGLYVIHDDVDLPLGKIKVSIGHGSAGHKGVESIIQAIGGNEFVRVRIGISEEKKIETERFVLSEFEEREEPKLRKAIKETVGAVELILKDGVERAANRYN